MFQDSSDSDRSQKSADEDSASSDESLKSADDSLESADEASKSETNAGKSASVVPAVEDEIFEIINIPGKGTGMIARRRIFPGSFSIIIILNLRILIFCSKYKGKYFELLKNMI